MKLFVISDLHLGGSSYQSAHNGDVGSQICQSYQALTQFIDSLAVKASDDVPVELVINGDIVDFLMEDDFVCDEDNHCSSSAAQPWLADESKIIKKLKKIVVQTREGLERGPFDAMSDLLIAGHYLTFILGNHDIELSLPLVRKYLERDLLKSKSGRFKFVFDGEAYVRGDLLIEHGNRYDKWNVVDFNALRQVRSMLSRGLSGQMLKLDFAQFKPPAGSVMVTQVINPLKRRYRFIDLLKPHDKAVVPILLAIHPKISYILSAILPAFRASQNEYISGAIPKNKNQLSADEQNDFDLKCSLEQALGIEDAKLFEQGINTGGQLSFSQTWENIKRLSKHISAWLQDEESLFVEGLKQVRYSLLHKALLAWRGGLVMDQNTESPEYMQALLELEKSNRFTCIIFGHTHLKKEIQLTGGLKYINTGTWADTMEVPAEVLQGGDSSEALHHFVENLACNNIQAYIKRSLSYAEVDMNDVDGIESVVSAKLQEFKPK